MKLANNGFKKKREKYMKPVSRRSFIQTSIAAGMAAVSPAVSRTGSRIIGANDEIQVGIVGLNGKGAHHVEMYGKIPGVRIRALCDVDENVLNERVNGFKSRNEKVDAYTDFRKMLEDKNLDAISIATQNHWHSLMAIMACQAGKDVYVEKPVSHNVWEGRKLVEAARKYKRIVQAGMQNRSDVGLIEAYDLLKGGKLGKPVAGYGLCYKRRASIGKVPGPQSIPKHVNYDLWAGPAPLRPLMRQNLHYDWHWVWDTGNGDIGNQGVHEMDLIRWGMNVGLPKRVLSFGGRFGYTDDGETPNTQVSIFEYDTVPLIFEVQGLPARKNDTAMANYKGIRVGVVLFYENGYFAGGRGGGWIYDNQGERIQQFKGDGGENHVPNFISAMRSRRVKDLRADVLEGHLSAALCHVANISYRLGTLSASEEIKKTLGGRAALEAYSRFEDHLFSNWIDLAQDKTRLGPWLEMDTEKERFLGEGGYSLTRWANDMLTRAYREPYVVPNKV